MSEEYKAKLLNRLNKYTTKGKDDECWEWNGFISAQGYGRIIVNNVNRLAHRMMYLLYVSDPGKLLVCHKCDNPKCVNPNHLFLGTMIDNINDRTKKGRGYKKITLDQRIIIRDAVNAGYNNSQIARYFKVNKGTIAYIKRIPPEKLTIDSPEKESYLRDLFSNPI